MFPRISRRTIHAAALLCVLASLVAGHAQAGDAAARKIIGFSPDGRYFAFEQYGTLDWSDNDSGWSEISIIDTTTDNLVDGKTIRVIDESSEAALPLDDARKQAREKAAPLLARYAIDRPGERIAFDAATRPDDRVAYVEIGPLEETSVKHLSLADGQALSLIPQMAASTEDCAFTLVGMDGDTAGKALGFRLVLAGDTGTPPQTLHDDKAVPASRHCPTSYSLSEAYAFTPKGRPMVIAVLVQRFSQGYEGRDRRFMAVTGTVGRR